MVAKPDICLDPRIRAPDTQAGSVGMVRILRLTESASSRSNNHVTVRLGHFLPVSPAFFDASVNRELGF